MEQLKQVLKANHIQITQQRLEVLRVLRKLNTHVTVDDVVQALKEEEITLTLATVYNILGIFEKKGLIMTSTPSRISISATARRERCGTISTTSLWN